MGVRDRGFRRERGPRLRKTTSLCKTTSRFAATMRKKKENRSQWQHSGGATHHSIVRGWSKRSERFVELDGTSLQRSFGPPARQEKVGSVSRPSSLSPHPARAQRVQKIQRSFGPPARRKFSLGRSTAAFTTPSESSACAGNTIERATLRNALGARWMQACIRGVDWPQTKEGNENRQKTIAIADVI